LDALAELFSQLQLWLFESVVQPLMFAAELGSRLEDGFSATGWLLVGCLQLLVMLLVIGPLQKWRPVEALTDRSAGGCALHPDSPVGPVSGGDVFHAGPGV
jgi:hypothetical protein